MPDLQNTTTAPGEDGSMGETGATHNSVVRVPERSSQTGSMGETPMPHNGTMHQGSDGWHAEYLREAAQARKYRQRAQRAESDLAQLRQVGRGDNDERLASLSQETAAKDARIAALSAMVKSTVGAYELHRALTGCGVGGSSALSQAAQLLAGRIDVTLADEGPQVRVLDGEGQPMLSDAGQPLDVGRFVSEWLAQEGQHFLPPSGDTGSGAHKGTAGRPLRVEDLDASPRRKAQFIAAYGAKAYVQLARVKGRKPK
ncbi:MAG: hypothetical protein ABFD92_09230 [Planctomycetaceae bacterium]|nr:hypothetical protein [Planctomycetaceae bacterium]